MPSFPLGSASHRRPPFSSGASNLNIAAGSACYPTAKQIPKTSPIALDENCSERAPSRPSITLNSGSPSLSSTSTPKDLVSDPPSALSCKPETRNDRVSFLDTTTWELPDGLKIRPGTAHGLPTPPNVISPLEDVFRDIRALPNILTSGIPVKPHIAQYFTEFKIMTDPSIINHNFVIVYEDALLGPRHLHGGESGFIMLKSFSEAVRPPNNASNIVTSSKLWIDIHNYSTEEEWDSPLLDDPQFFKEHASLLFAERPGLCSNSGDPLYEFLGNFYIRRYAYCDDAASQMIFPAGSYERVLEDLPHLSPALVILQFTEDKTKPI